MLAKGQAARVGMVDLGEDLPIRIPVLCRKLNSLQKSLGFHHAGIITTERLGAPDVGGRYYSARRVFSVLAKCGFPGRSEFAAGLTRHMLMDEPRDGTHQRIECFSMSDFKTLSVIGLGRGMTRHRSPTKTIYQYAAYLTMCELLQNMVGASLSHEMPRFCLFDECEDRPSLGDCMDRHRICSRCVPRLERGNVPKAVLDDVQRVLNWCGGVTILSAARQALQCQGTSIAMGVGLGWLAGKMLPDPSLYPVVVAVVAGVPLLVTVGIQPAGVAQTAATQ